MLHHGNNHCPISKIPTNLWCNPIFNFAPQDLHSGMSELVHWRLKHHGSLKKCLEQHNKERKIEELKKERNFESEEKLLIYTNSSYCHTLYSVQNEQSIGYQLRIVFNF
ncbi:hypothetical protein AAZX31_20G044900 [Glycine max]